MAKEGWTMVGFHHGSTENVAFTMIHQRFGINLANQIRIPMGI
jgi:hypothetical protein